MRHLICLCIVYISFGCNNNEKNSHSTLETVLKEVSGVHTDMDNLNNKENNKARLEIKDNGLDLNNRFNNGFATITASKEGITITITDIKTGHDNLVIYFSGNDLTKMRPIKGKLNLLGDNTMNFSTVNHKNNVPDMQIAFEVEGEIISLNPEKTIIYVKGNMGNTGDAQNLDKWNSFEGLITLNDPVFQTIGNRNEDFVY